MKPARYGLRSSIFLYDTVVEQCVLWEQNTQWMDLPLNVPTPNEQAVAAMRWQGRSIEFRDETGTVHSIQEDGDDWVWEGPSGVSIRFDRIKMKRAKRGSGEAWGDVALLVLMLTLMVGVGQVNILIQSFLGGVVDSTATLEPTPELIARYLLEEYSGAESGNLARVERPASNTSQAKTYLPAGSKGPMDRAGGGANQGLETRRRPPTEEPLDRIQDSSDRDLPELTITDPKQIEIIAPRPELHRPDSPRTTQSIERFVGWGFHDWLDVAESNSATKKQMEERLGLAQEIMRIDPNDPFALLTVSYYAYLSENHTLCRDLYERYISLYPEDAAGWNNLALSYKRTGDYDKEEQLYRVALSIEPDNSNTKNNLAVNLARQGRFNEARALMDQLELKPEEVPYAELHLAKISAAEGKDKRAYRHIKRALEMVNRMDTFHHIEFRQDIRVDPSFKRLRKQSKFRALLEETYGAQSPLAIGQSNIPAVVADG